MFPVISIITVSLNQGDFIGETIESVLKQEGDFYIDYIIMDGGSRDQTLEIIRGYERKLSENCLTGSINGQFSCYKSAQDNQEIIKCMGVSFRWYSSKDEGQVYALKHAFSLAFGDIYHWLNSDDYLLHDNVLSKIIQQFSLDPSVHLITGDGMIINRSGSQTGVWHCAKINFRELLFLDYHILQPSTFFRKSVYNSNSLDEKMICAFDADFFIHLIYDGNNIMKIEDKLSAIRIYPEIKTISLSNLRYKESLRISKKYSENIYYYSISLFYKLFSIVLISRIDKPGKLTLALFEVIRKVCYLLITGRPGRTE
ncbi:MAG: glycosyltransferase [Bacteroidales bacterium]|nr:glycosyltransferase [Bacteroidales bacterium]